MASKYQFGENDIPHFVTFSVVNWIDTFTRIEYKDVLVDSLKYCIEKKGLILNAWIIMTNHTHLIMRTENQIRISDIVRDLKKFTSKQIVEAISTNPKESRKGWLLWMFERAGRRNMNNEINQFWQQNNHPIELNTDEKLKQRLNYLHENPVKAGIVFEPQNYVYSSATDYYTDRPGLIKLELC
jgi:putative transposase